MYEAFNLTVAYYFNCCIENDWVSCFYWHFSMVYAFIVCPFVCLSVTSRHCTKNGSHNQRRTI